MPDTSLSELSTMTQSKGWAPTTASSAFEHAEVLAIGSSETLALHGGGQISGHRSSRQWDLTLSGRSKLYRWSKAYPNDTW
jgi:hypothetical protein